MDAVRRTNWIEALGLTERRVPEFFQSLQQIEQEAHSSQVSTMRRAWQELGLSGILCVDSKPSIYFKDVPNIEASEMRATQSKLWNHGIAPLLIVTSEQEVHVYSALALPTKNNDDYDKANRLLETFSRIAQALEIKQLVQSIEVGEFFRKYEEKLNPELRVDRYLLVHLEAARQKLEAIKDKAGNTLDQKTVYALLGRIVFTCYLIDRAVIVPDYLTAIGAGNAQRLLDVLSNSPYEAKRLLYSLFQRLQKDFNGNLFDENLNAEALRVNDEHIQVLRDFLRGDNPLNPQMSLGFFPYNFEVIPIETISAIYESFLKTEGEDAKRGVGTGAEDERSAKSTGRKRQTGAYFTPRFLAELVLDTAWEGWSTFLDKRFLDPSCGSGVFLVGLFNAMAEEWSRNNPNPSPYFRYTSLRKILTDQLFGIDVDETACRITAFSLYLALLDQIEPKDIQKLIEQYSVLPMLVLLSDQKPDGNENRSIICRNFFDASLPLAENHFDLVVGNPPWVRSKTDAYMQLWRRQAKVEIPQEQIACAFMIKAANYIKQDGRICFLLPIKTLLPSPTNSKALQFQKDWFSQYHVDRIVNLADTRFYLFEDAIRPAMIVRYHGKNSGQAETAIQYSVPKSDYEALRTGILTITADDTTNFTLREILANLSCKNASLLWKTAMWGTSRDLKFLDRLFLLPQLAEIVSKASERTKKRWVIGQGFQPAGSSLNPQWKYTTSPFKPSDLFLESRSMQSLVLNKADCVQFANRFQLFRWLTNAREIFGAPHVLVTKSLKASYADFDVLFQHAIQGIHGPKTDEKLLMFLAAVLNSSFAKYFLFHTASDWGTERDEVLEDELLRLPFFLPEQASNPDIAEAIIEQVAQFVVQAQNLGKNRHKREKKISSKQLAMLEEEAKAESTETWNKRLQQQFARLEEQILELIYQYYDIDRYERLLIEDTISVWEPSSTPARGAHIIPTLELSDKEKRTEYVSRLVETLNDWTKYSDYSITGYSIVDEQLNVGLVVLKRDAKSASPRVSPEKNSTEAFRNSLTHLQSALLQRQGSINYLRNLKVFIEDELYIFKPFARRYWTQTSALNDADEIAATVLFASMRNK